VGSLFCGVRAAAAVRGRVLVMVRKLRVQWVPFFAPLRSMAASTSSMESRRLPRTIF
jgi:hypothetical protein